MTQEQKTELEYLIDLLREASKWNVDQGDDALRLEVDLRINTILNGEGTPSDQVETCEVEVNPVLTEDDFRDLEAAKLNEHLNEKREKQKIFKQRWKADKIRCMENGRVVWHPKTECHKEVIPGFKTKWRWVWHGNKESDDAKKEQIEEMWNQHDSAGN